MEIGIMIDTEQLDMLLENNEENKKCYKNILWEKVYVQIILMNILMIYLL